MQNDPQQKTRLATPFGVPVSFFYLGRFATDPFLYDACGIGNLLNVILKVLTQVAFSYAIAIGRSDLKKVPGIKLLHDTYRYRQETYCGITEQADKGTLQFMLHRTLGNNVQADYYRSFTRESGRQFLLDAVQLDRRFMEENRRKRRATTKVVGEITVYTFPAPPDGEMGAIHTVTLDLTPDQLAQFQVPQGCYISVIEKACE